MESKNKAKIYLNYKRKNKWFGIIDYKSLIFLCIYSFIIISILRFLPIKLEYLIYLFIFLVIPVVASVLINVGEESAIDTLITVLKFCINNKIYVKIKYINKLDKEEYKLKNK